MQIKILNTITLEKNINITLIGDGIGGAKGIPGAGSSITNQQING
jgi:hypothetical protein